MSSAATPASSKLFMRLGWALSLLPSLGLLASATMKVVQPAALVEKFTGTFGWPLGVLIVLAVLEGTSTVLYLIPRTSVLGAILLTGYLGGAVATHVRVGDVFVTPLALGIMVWGGLYLRDARVRALIPFNSKQ